MISKLNLTFVVILLLPGSIFPVLAAEESPDAGKAILPSIGVQFSYDSNIYSSNLNEVESWIGVVTPKILLRTTPGPQRYALLYEGRYGRIFESSVDNYADHKLTGGAQFQLGERGEFDFSAVAIKGHEGRGSELTAGIDPNSPSFARGPDEFDDINWDGRFRYGAQGARGRLDFRIGHRQLDYTNNRDRTQNFDRESQFGSASISVRLRPRTAIVLAAIYADTQYDNTPSGNTSRDGDGWRYLLGVAWEATAKTEGSISLGTQRRRFDDPARAKESTASWEVDVRWSPREYSRFDFVTSRKNEETIGEGAFIDRSEYRITWTHQWNRGWDSIIKWNSRDDRFVAAGRKEDLSEWYFGLRYPQGRLLTWNTGFSHRSRDSNLNNLVFDGNMFTIGVNIGL